MSAQARAEIRAAAEHIRTHGWRQHGYGAPTRPCCVVGALIVSRFSQDGCVRATEEGEAVRLVRETLARRMGYPVFDLITWNDSPLTTKEAVLDLLDEAGREPEGGAS